MHLVDWAIVAVLAIGLTWVSFMTKRYLRGVADFLSANRSAGRFLLTIAGSMSSVGAISVVAMFEAYYAAGLPPNWWQMMTIPLSIVIVMTGWVFYRFRETRCMTMAQFYEVRYSKPFRIYAGLITFASGIVNFGIFPAVAARFFVYFCGFAPTFELAGMTIPTFAPIMIATLGIALLYTCIGGQVTVLVTDAVQGMFCGFIFIIISFYFLGTYNWADVEKALIDAPYIQAKERLATTAQNKREEAEKVRSGKKQVFMRLRGTPEEIRAKMKQQSETLREEATGAVTTATEALAKARQALKTDGPSRSAERAELKALAQLHTAKLLQPVRLAHAQRELEIGDAVAALQTAKLAKAGNVAALHTAAEQVLRTARADYLVDEARGAEAGLKDEVILRAAAAGRSMLDPFDTSRVKDFNLWFYLIMVALTFYGYMSWQGSQGYFSSALSPHEQKMGQIIGLWRSLPQLMMFLLIPVCAITFLTLPQYAEGAAQVRAVLAETPDATIATQMRVSVALAHMLPIGLKGAFCAIMLFFLITTQDTYLHSWGSIFVQDCVLPFRKKPFTPKGHVTFLRYSIIGVGIFSFMWSLLFKQTEYILMYFAITGAIVAGLGAVIVGGLYWRGGSTLGAYTAMTIGWVLAVGRQANRFALEVESIRSIDFPGPILKTLRYINGINAQWISLWIVSACLGSYVLVSLLTRKRPFHIERMLHRGKYAVEGDHVKAKDATRAWWVKMIGITSEFSFWDRMLAYALIVWKVAWIVVFAVGTICGVFFWGNGDHNHAWSRFWHGWIWFHLVIGTPAIIWFTIGGIKDIRALFRRLATLQRNDADDGRVVHHHLATEADRPGDDKLDEDEVLLFDGEDEAGEDK